MENIQYLVNMKAISIGAVVIYDRIYNYFFVTRILIKLILYIELAFCIMEKMCSEYFNCRERSLYEYTEEWKHGDNHDYFIIAWWKSEKWNFSSLIKSHSIALKLSMTQFLVPKFLYVWRKTMKDEAVDQNKHL